MSADCKRVFIRGGRVVDPSQQLDQVADVAIAGGEVVGIGDAVPQGFSADREIDASTQVVCPGLIDLRSHLREPGHEHKATIASEVRAARAGGITTLCCPPDTDPIIDTAAVAELVQARAAAQGCARVLPLGALTHGLDGNALAEMAELKSAGCVGMSNALRPIENTLVLRRAMEYADSFGLTVFIHPRDPWLTGRGCAHAGAVATRIGLPGIPESAETAALARNLILVEQTGARTHFFLLSSARAVSMIADARRQGLPVSADVSAHHLHLSELDIAEFDANCHVHPPLRSLRDLDGLRRGIADGSLGAICSDHQPHEGDAKLAPFCLTEPGISGLETLLSLSLRLVHEGVIDMSTLVDRLATGPAHILGLQLGSLRAGAIADVCIFDPELYWQVEPQRLRSAGHNTPFGGWELRGRVTHTLFAGRVVYTLAGARKAAEASF